jgi:hypothetical protein
VVGAGEGSTLVNLHSAQSLKREGIGIILVA